MKNAIDPHKASNEASLEHLIIAEKEGKSFKRALREMIKKQAHGAEKTAGDFYVAYAIEKPEGFWEWENGNLAWKEPLEENCHIEVVVRDASGRFLPGLDIEVTILDDEGDEVGKNRHEFIWHPWLFHYGKNWKIPSEGNYTIKIRVNPPQYRRHDKINGRRYTSPAEVEFDRVRITPFIKPVQS